LGGGAGKRESIGSTIWHGTPFPADQQRGDGTDPLTV